MKNTKNKFDAVDYVNQMNHLYSNGPKPKGDTIQQLLDLKEWSQNPERYERRLNFRAGQAKKKIIKVAGIKDSSLYKLLKNPKVIGVDLGHDTILEIINLIQNSGLVKKPKVQPKKDQVADKQLIKWALEESPVPIVKKPKPKPTHLNRPTVEETIKRIAYQRKLAENKLSGLNEEFVKQKLREQMS